MSSVGLCELRTWPAPLGATSCRMLGRSCGAAALPDLQDSIKIGVLLMCICPKAPQAIRLAAGECQVPPPHGSSAWEGSRLGAVGGGRARAGSLTGPRVYVLVSPVSELGRGEGWWSHGAGFASVFL